MPRGSSQAFVPKSKEGHVAGNTFEQTSEYECNGCLLLEIETRNVSFVTLVIPLVRTVSRRKEKRFFAVIKLSSTTNFFFLKNVKLGTASTTNTLELDDLHDMCPTAFDVHTPIKPSSVITHTYGGGVIKSVGQIELICETQRKLHNLLFEHLSC